MLKFLDDAINELDTMESVVSSYKIHLNVGQLAMRCLAVIESILSQAVSDDIVYIQGQGRGLQVQTQNQRALLNELEELLVCYAMPIYQRVLPAETVVIANCASWWRCLARAHTRVSRASRQYQEA